MTEIELKAHVYDRNALVQNLKTFAHREQRIIREDEYYGKSEKDSHKIRIRHETFISEDGNTSGSDYLVTYKRKEIKCGADNISIEVNDEKECTISDPAALKSFLTDTGYSIQLKKYKDVEDWSTELCGIQIMGQNIIAMLEICNVPPLGDFIEIEILSPVSDGNTTQMLHGELLKLLDKCKIPKTDIEPRYYSELLRETSAQS